LTRFSRCRVRELNQTGAIQYKSRRGSSRVMRRTRAVRKCRTLTRPITLSLLFAASLLICASAQNSTDSLAPIYSALQNQEFDKALALLQPLLQQSPNVAQLWAMQGAAYAGKGKKEDALVSFRQALKISPDYLPALHGAAQIEYDDSNPAGIPLIQHVLRLHPEDLTSHGMLAILEYQQGKCDAAVPHFEKAAALFGSRPAALHAFAICLARLKQYDHAASVVARTVALSPDDPHERQLLAAIQLMANKPSDAMTTLDPLMQAKDPDPLTLELVSRAYEGMKQTTEAVSVIRRAILLDPQNVNLYLDFANLCYTHDSFQVGIDVISDGLALQPKAAPLYFARGVLYIQLAQYDKGEADFEKAYEIDPNQSLSSAAQGLAAAQENNFDRALARVQASLARKPDDAFMLYLQADILATRSAGPGTPDFELAMRSARRAVQLQPTLAPARSVLAKLDLESGKNKEAAEECRKALENDPKDQAAVYHLIQALRKTGDTKEIPDLLKRLAALRREAAKEQNDRYRFQLVEGDSAH
jgi:tetratricopeptide (TPR) repeat protein